MIAHALALSLHFPAVDWLNPDIDPRLVATATHLLDRKD